MGQSHGGEYGSGGTSGNARLAEPNVFTAGQSYLSVDKGSVASGTVGLSPSANNAYRLTVVGPLSIAFTGWNTSGILDIIYLELVDGGKYSVNIPGVVWVLAATGMEYATLHEYLVAMGRVPAALNENGTDRLIFTSSNGGAKIIGKLW